jgi:hypothetical protein
VQGGDLSNALSMRVYVVFEGTLANPRPGLKTGVLKKIMGQSLRDLDVDPEMTKHLWDIWQRLGVRFDAVTFTYDADDVQEWIDRTNLPVHTTWRFVDRRRFIEQMAYMPWISHVIDHEAPMAYGSRSSTVGGLRR